LLPLVIRFAHALPHRISPGLMQSLHTLAVQIWVAVHTAVHVPQWLGSDGRLTHISSQGEKPATQLQTPAVQALLAAQACPHVRQLVRSFCKSTHAAPHGRSVPAQVHWPAVHCCAIPQAVAH
jgi:hypothetical protein